MFKEYDKHSENNMSVFISELQNWQRRQVLSGPLLLVHSMISKLHPEFDSELSS